MLVFQPLRLVAARASALHDVLQSARDRCEGADVHPVEVLIGEGHHPEIVIFLLNLLKPLGAHAARRERVQIIIALSSGREREHGDAAEIFAFYVR
eukprot:1342103-Prymnesium_polylepis.2